MNTFKPELFLDFDKTISPVHGFHAAPSEKVVNSIKKLSEKYKIVIFSCRANPDICSKPEAIAMVEYLNRYNIVYDEIYYRKPLYAVLIDDRAYNPTQMSWDDITNELLSD